MKLVTISLLGLSNATQPNNTSLVQLRHQRRPISDHVLIYTADGKGFDENDDNIRKYREITKQKPVNLA